jgi:hypothetical protein
MRAKKKLFKSAIAKILILRLIAPFCGRTLLSRFHFDFHRKLLALSLLSSAVSMGAALWATYGHVSAVGAFACYMAGALMGMLVFIALAARFFERHFSEFKVAKIAPLGFYAFIVYLAHGQAVGEVNAIFGIDAASLPHATAAASTMLIATWLYKFVLLPTCFGAVVLTLYYFGVQREGSGFIGFAILLSALIVMVLISRQAAVESQRRGNVYQIALQMDVNKKSLCENVPPDAEGVIFIGPDQLRAIVVPHLVITETNALSIFKGVELPAKFDVVKCG